MSRGISQVGLVAKNPPTKEIWVRSLSWDDRWEEGKATTPVFLPGESHGQRSLVGDSPQGHKELDMTEATLHAPAHSWVGALIRRIFAVWIVLESHLDSKEIKPLHPKENQPQMPI